MRLKVLVLLFAIVTPLVAWDGPAQPLAPGTNVHLLSTPAGTFAIRPRTVISGDVLEDFDANSQPDLLACAASCMNHTGCTAVNYCEVQGGCKILGDVVPQNGCQLLMRASLFGLAVYELASDEPHLPIGGVLHAATADPGPVPGYVEFFGATLLGPELDIPSCTGSVAPGKCVLPGTLKDAEERCNSMPRCQAFTFGPPSNAGPLGKSKTPLIGYVGYGDGRPIDINSSSGLSPLMITYVKQGQLAANSSNSSTSAQEEQDLYGDGEGGGLSGGAIAGIVVGALCASAAVLAAAALFQRRRRARARHPGERTEQGGDLEAGKSLDSPSPRPSSHQQSGCRRLDSSRSDEISGAGFPVDLLSSKSISGSSGSVESATLRLLAEAPGPQWQDVLVPRDAVQLCRDSKGELIKLGGGVSGNVYRATLRGSTVCACKVFEFGNAGSTPKHFIEEVRLLWRLNHPCVVQFLAAAVTESQGLLVMELMPGGDLFSRLQAEMPGGRGRMFAWQNKGRRVALSVASAIAHLHHHRVCHFDVKSKNVLLSQAGEAKLADVGFSRLVPGGNLGALESRLGTFDWCAPEVLLGHSASNRADIFSWGVLLWEICTGERPTRGAMRPLVAPADCPAEVVALQHRCCATDPSLRPSASEIVEILSSCKRDPGQGDEASASGSAHASAAPGSRHGSKPGELRVVRCVEIPCCPLESPLAGARVGETSLPLPPYSPPSSNGSLGTGDAATGAC